MARTSPNNGAARSHLTHSHRDVPDVCVAVTSRGRSQIQLDGALAQDLRRARATTKEHLTLNDRGDVVKW